MPAHSGQIYSHYCTGVVSNKQCFILLLPCCSIVSLFRYQVHVHKEKADVIEFSQYYFKYSQTVVMFSLSGIPSIGYSWMVGVWSSFCRQVWSWAQSGWEPEVSSVSSMVGLCSSTHQAVSLLIWVQWIIFSKILSLCYCFKKRSLDMHWTLCFQFLKCVCVCVLPLGRSFLIVPDQRCTSSLLFKGHHPSLYPAFPF